MIVHQPIKPEPYNNLQVDTYPTCRGPVRGGPGVVPSIQCSNGQIVVSWDLGGWGVGPRGSWSRSVNTMFKWTNSGFVGPGGGWGVVRGGTGVDPSIQCSNGQIVVSWTWGGGGVVRGGTGVDPSIQCSNGQIVVSWDLGGVGGCPRGSWSRSVNTMFKWTNSGFVGPGGGGGWSAGVLGSIRQYNVQMDNRGFVGPGGVGGWSAWVLGSIRQYNVQMDK